MQINHISGQAYYVDAPINLGILINNENEALLIDTGIDDSVGRKVRRLLAENGFILKAIFLTHHHADHTGGAPFLVKATNAAVYSGWLEKAFIESPIIEPLYLFSGAAPPLALKSKFFLAPGVEVTKTVDAGDCLDGWGCQVVNLAGHSLGQLGLLTNEGVLYAADSVIGPEYIIKHGIPLNADISQTLATYQRLLDYDLAYLLPGHGQLCTDYRSLVKVNQDRIEEICNLMLDTIRENRRWEDILGQIAEKVAMPISNQGQYVLANLSAAAYLSYLQQAGFIKAEYNEGRQFLKLT